jgi:DNA-directed RNA polymerase beta' subunit
MNKTKNELEKYVIKGVSLSFYDKPTIQSLSAIRIDKGKHENNIGTPLDPRLGGPDVVCATCGLLEACPGHMGYIELDTYICNPVVIREILYVLQSVCHKCSRLLIPSEIIYESDVNKYHGVKRFKEIAAMSKNAICCGKNPVYAESKAGAKNGEAPMICDKVKKMLIPVDTILDILKGIGKKDLEALGFNESNHPANFIFTVVPVIPTCARPQTEREGVVSNDILTVLYSYIANPADKKKQNTQNNSRASDIAALTGARKLKDDMKQKTVKARITGKEGYTRNNVNGKRNDKCARSVLSSNNDIKFGEVSIPQAMRQFLTTPMVVTPYNVEKINQYFTDGLIDRITLKGEAGQRDIKRYHEFYPRRPVRVGDTVERILMDGDVVFFGRQPTLHKYSLMAYRASINPDPKVKTIGLHSSYTTPHNADFDGDEGNINKFQTNNAIAEGRYIANVESCIYNIPRSKPSMGLVYNSLSAAYIMSQDNKMNESFFDKCVKKVPKPPTLDERLAMHKIDSLHGKAMFSYLLPPDLFYEKDDVVIKNGVLVKGIIKESHIGPTQNSIVHVIAKYYGKQEVSNFLTYGQYLTDSYITMTGFSIRLSDCLEKQEKIESVVREQIGQLLMEERQITNNFLGDEQDELKLSKNDQELLNNRRRETLNKSSVLGSKLSKKILSPNNPLNVMSESGAKGNATNTAQIAGIVGQQYVETRLPPLQLNGGSRYCVYYPKHSKDIRHRGFIDRSFARGIKAGDLEAHIQASRHGIISTAIKTGIIGDLHRRVVKALEDVYIASDYTTRIGNSIVQFIPSDAFNSGMLIPTQHTETGKILNFVNCSTIAAIINSKYEDTTSS